MSYIKIDSIEIECPYGQDGWEDGNICAVQPNGVSCAECIIDYIAELETLVRN